MHDDLKSLTQKPTHKFVKNLSILEDPKFFKKFQKLGKKSWNAW